MPTTRSRGKLGDRLRDVAHRVQRVRDDDEGRLGRVLHGVLRHGGDDRLVRRHEVVAAHAGGPRLPRRDDDDVRALGLLVAVRAGDVRLVREHGRGLVHVESLALRVVGDDVDEDDVRVVAAGDLLRACGADVAGADDGHLSSHATRSSEFVDDRVGDLARPNGRRVVSRGLHVVREALTLGDHGGDCGLEPRCCAGLVEMIEHELAGQDHRDRVDLVLAPVLRRRAVGRLEDGRIGADVRAGCDAEAAD